jgi:hypothetical protein
MIAISDTMSKLKSALVEITALNSRLVMRNNKLAIELSFMPPDMRQKIVLEKNARSKIVLEQRTNPHHLMPDTAKQVKYYFTKADMSAPNVAKLQRDETVTSVKELLDEVEDIMKMMGVANTANDLEEYEEGEDVQETYATPQAPRAQDTKGVNTNAEEGVNKRAHENSAHTGHKVHPTKVPRVEPMSALR